MQLHLEECMDLIDAALFTGDTFENAANREKLINTAERWLRELKRIEERHGAVVACDQCEAVMIQGVYCHEQGCPNHKT